MPPESIAGFALERLLGKGAHSEVWLAHGPGGGPVALKMLHSVLHADAAARRRFEREIQATTSIRHPNVVRTLEAGTWNERPFLVCDYVAGGSLQDLLDRQHRLPASQALELAAGILRGLAAIHRHGLVHRDLKPANVLLEAGRVPKLADLGLARSTAAGRTLLTADAEIVGTPAYLAPEQIERGQDVDATSRSRAITPRCASRGSASWCTIPPRPTARSSTACASRPRPSCSRTTSCAWARTAPR